MAHDTIRPGIDNPVIRLCWSQRQTRADPDGVSPTRRSQSPSRKAKPSPRPHSSEASRGAMTVIPASLDSEKKNKTDDGEQAIRQLLNDARPRLSHGSTSPLPETTKPPIQSRWRNRRVPDRWRRRWSFQPTSLHVSAGRQNQGTNVPASCISFPLNAKLSSGFGARLTYAIQSVGEVIHGAAQFLQVKWLWEDRLHVQPFIGFADFW